MIARSGDRHRLRGCQRRGIDVLEARDDSGVAAGLVGRCEIDVRLRQHHQRVGVAATIDQGFGAAIGHRVVAGAGMDDVGTATAVDRVCAGPAGDDVDRRSSAVIETPVLSADASTFWKLVTLTVSPVV